MPSPGKLRSSLTCVGISEVLVGNQETLSLSVFDFGSVQVQNLPLHSWPKRLSFPMLIASTHCYGWDVLFCLFFSLPFFTQSVLMPISCGFLSLLRSSFLISASPVSLCRCPCLHCLHLYALFLSIPYMLLTEHRTGSLFEHNLVLHPSGSSLLTAPVNTSPHSCSL